MVYYLHLIINDIDELQIYIEIAFGQRLSENASDVTM